MRKEEAMIADLPPALKLDGVLIRLNADDAVRNEANIRIMIEAARARPEFVHHYPTSQVIFERGAVKDRREIVSNHSDIRRCIFRAQDFGGRHAGNAIANNHIGLPLNHP
jgi:hypothetical protein